MPRQRTSRIQLRMTSSERANVEQHAHDAGLGLSEYVRRRLKSDGAVPFIKTDVETLRLLYRDLRYAGNNVNQIARQLNKWGTPEGIKRQISSALYSIAEASSAVSKFINETQASISGRKRI